MAGTFVLIILQVSGVMGALVLLDTIICANLYDARQIAYEHQQKLITHTLLRSKQPLITILIAAHNDEAFIQQSIKSIAQSAYRTHQTIIIDYASTDNTRKFARDAIKQYPKKSMRIVARRLSNHTFLSEYEVFKKYGRGELILRLDARDVLDKHALSRAVWHFSKEPKLTMLRSKNVISSAWMVAGLFAIYQNCLREISLKAASVNNADLYLQEQAFFRKGTFIQLAQEATRHKRDLDGLRLLANRQNRSKYAEDVIIVSTAQPTIHQFFRRTYTFQIKRVHSFLSQRQIIFKAGYNYTKYLSWLRLPMVLVTGFVGLLVPLMITYFIYLAVRVEDPVFLIVSCLILAVILLFAIWGERQFSVRQKILYSLGIPMTYAVFYGISLMQYFVIIGGLLSKQNDPI
jgi:glycosyltransferase involved in cell wall biosynthesis